MYVLITLRPTARHTSLPKRRSPLIRSLTFTRSTHKHRDKHKHKSPAPDTALSKLKAQGAREKFEALAQISSTHSIVARINVGISQNNV